MLFRKSSNLFLSFSLICEVCNVQCKCFLKLFFQVLKINIRVCNNLSFQSDSKIILKKQYAYVD